MSTATARRQEAINNAIEARRVIAPIVHIPSTAEVPSGHAGTAIRDYLSGANEIRYKTMTSPYRIEGGRLLRTGKITRWWSIQDQASADAMLTWLKAAKKTDERHLIGMSELDVRRLIKEKRFGFAVQVRRVVQQVLAQRINGLIIGNSSGLGMQRRKDLNDDSSARPLEAQRFLSLCVPMLPFGVFDQMGLGLDTLEIVDQGKEETFYLKTSETKANPSGARHFTGASLFSIGGKSFLFDIDRGDMELGVFNPFLSRLPHPCKTIGEAYRSLKPGEVAAAELAGKKVIRQGEWFFLPVDGVAKASNVVRDDLGRAKEGILQSKGNRPHFTSLMTADGLVGGRVRHGGFEHPPMDLPEGKWFKPVPNTAVESWSLEGRVD